MVRGLSKSKKTIAVAESCTGGFIGHRLTNVSGASEVFQGGVVAYSYELKKKILGVDEIILNKFGAVSRECAMAMAKGLSGITGADFCVATTGIAGPTGGTSDKPVGTVHVVIFSDGEFFHKEYCFPLGRERFKRKVSSVVLAQVLKML